MHTYPANFVNLMSQDTGEEWRILLEIEAATTLYYSNQAITVGAQAYTATVKNFGGIQNGSIRLELYNTPRIDNLIKPGQLVTIDLWMVGLASGDKATRFKGRIGKDISGSKTHTMSFSVLPVGAWFDKEVLQPLSPASYPNADPADYGKMIPEILGTVENVQCLTTEAGFATTLRGDINNSVATVPITDYAHDSLIIPASGAVLIGEERITYTSVTQSDTPTLNGCTRGTGGTTANSHFNGDAVLEDAASLEYKLCNSDVINPQQSITKPRIKPHGLTVKEAVQIDAADYSVNLNTGIITLTNLPNIRAKVASEVSQQPIHTDTTQPAYDVDPDVHAHVDDNQVISFYNDTNINFGFSSVLNNTFAIDRAFAQGGSWDPNLSNWEIKVQRQAQPEVSGDLVSGVVNAMLWRSVSSDFTVQVKWYLNGVKVAEKDCVLNSTAVTYVTASVDLSAYVFSDFLNANSYVTVTSTSGIPSGVIYVNEIWFDLTITPPSASRFLTAPQSQSMDFTQQNVLLAGDTVAGSLGGPLIANCEGRKDTAAGHYTGTPNALIVKPWEQAHFMLESFSEVTHSDIDIAGSFADCDTNLPATWEWGLVINTQFMLNLLLEKLAIQTWARFRWSIDGLARLERIKTSGAAIRTLDTASDSFLSGKLGDTNRDLQIKWKKQNLNQIVNDVVVKYLIDLTTGNWSNPDAYNGLTEDSDAPSISEFEERKRTWLMWAVRDDTMADTLRDYLLAWHKDLHQPISFPTDWTQLELQSNDLVNITCTQLGLSSALHRVFNADTNLPDALRGEGLKIPLTLIEL